MRRTIYTSAVAIAIALTGPAFAGGSCGGCAGGFASLRDSEGHILVKGSFVGGVVNWFDKSVRRWQALENMSDEGRKRAVLGLSQQSSNVTGLGNYTFADGSGSGTGTGTYGGGSGSTYVIQNGTSYKINVTVKPTPTNGTTNKSSIKRSMYWKSEPSDRDWAYAPIGGLKGPGASTPSWNWNAFGGQGAYVNTQGIPGGIVGLTSKQAAAGAKANAAAAKSSKKK